MKTLKISSATMQKLRINRKTRWAEPDGQDSAQSCVEKERDSENGCVEEQDLEVLRKSRS